MSGIEGTNPVTNTDTAGVYPQPNSANTEITTTNKEPIFNTEKTGQNNTGKQTDKQETSARYLKQLSDEGRAEYVKPNFISRIANKLLDGYAGDYIQITGFDNSKKLTLGEAKQQLKDLNLPIGCLRHLVSSGGGDFDTYELPKDKNGNYYLTIYLDAIEEASGLSKKEIKEIFSPSR